MARGEWGNQARTKWVCSYKKTTLIVCSINIVVALYVLRSLYSTLYIYSDNHSRVMVKYTPDQLKKMEESVLIRRAAEPLELIKLLKKYRKELSGKVVVVELPQHLKRSLTDEIIQSLKTLSPNANISEQRAEAVESWRKKKLDETKQFVLNNGTLDSTVSHVEAEMLAKALEYEWAVLSEEIGLWIPSVFIHKEHHDKIEGEVEVEEEILAGRPLPPECHTDLHTDYGGVAVRWGLTHHKESAADCCEACLDHARHAKSGEKKCNIWVYCPSESGCHSPDIYQHKLGECWLKYAEKPRLNFKDEYPESYRNSHPSAPLVVPWVSGVTG